MTHIDLTAENTPRPMVIFYRENDAGTALIVSHKARYPADQACAAAMRYIAHDGPMAVVCGHLDKPLLTFRPKAPAPEYRSRWDRYKPRPYESEDGFKDHPESLGD